MQLIVGAGEALAKLQKYGFKLILISNQSGIGRGYLTWQELEEVHQRMVSLLSQYGVCLTGHYYCPHSPQENCMCRKPSSQMILRAADEFHLDVESSFMIGDTEVDMLAGRNAGCRTIYLSSGSNNSDSVVPADLVASNWFDVVQYILGKHENIL